MLDFITLDKNSDQKVTNRFEFVMLVVARATDLFKKSNNEEIKSTVIALKDLESGLSDPVTLKIKLINSFRKKIDPFEDENDAAQEECIVEENINFIENPNDFSLDDEFDLSQNVL